MESENECPRCLGQGEYGYETRDGSIDSRPCDCPAGREYTLALSRHRRLNRAVITGYIQDAAARLAVRQGGGR